MNYYQLTFETLTLRENLIAKINSLQITTKEASKRVQDLYSPEYLYTKCGEYHLIYGNSSLINFF
jgi:hypothetical protein